MHCFNHLCVHLHLQYVVVCLSLRLCVHACMYWQELKEMFSPRPSLIYPTEYKELLKGYITPQNQGPLGDFTAFKASLSEDIFLTLIRKSLIFKGKED